MRINKFLLTLALLLLPATIAAQDMVAPQEPEDDSSPGTVEEPDAAPPEAAPATPEKAAPVDIPGIDKNIPEDEVEEPQDEVSDKWQAMPLAKLQGLNKITARTSELKMPLEVQTKFGNLDIVVEKCMHGPEDEKTENTALMTIWAEIPGQSKTQVFHGWMFSSSPAISALEHPIYDVILLGCESDKPAPAPQPEPAKPATKAKTKK